MHPLKVNKIYYIIAIFGIILLGSCKQQNSFDSEEALWAYLKKEDNGYLQTKIVNGVTYRLLYKPTDLLVKQELKPTDERTQIDNLRRKYDKYCYFSLSMSKANQELLNSMAGNRQKFGAMVNQLAFGMQEKIHLFNQKRDTIPLLDYIYPRMYGMSKSTSILLVYPRDELKDATELNITIKDLGFGTGEVKLTQQMNEIINQPRLKL